MAIGKFLDDALTRVIFDAQLPRPTILEQIMARRKPPHVRDRVFYGFDMGRPGRDHTVATKATLRDGVLHVEEISYAQMYQDPAQEHGTIDLHRDPVTGEVAMKTIIRDHMEHRLLWTPPSVHREVRLILDQHGRRFPERYIGELLHERLYPEWAREYEGTFEPSPPPEPPKYTHRTYPTGWAAIEDPNEPEGYRVVRSGDPEYDELGGIYAKHLARSFR